jgi:hypothetical protein
MENIPRGNSRQKVRWQTKHLKPLLENRIAA